MKHLAQGDSISDQYLNIVDKTNIVSKTDLNGVITYVNSKFVEISGYSENELLGQAHNIVRDPDQESSLFKELWSSIKAGKTWTGVITNLKKDGTKYTVNASIFPISNEEGETVEYIAIRHDVTELLKLNRDMEELHYYNQKQEQRARVKLEAGIVNDASLECQVLYHPSDVLSGDFYSIYKRDDGSIFIYMLDGQGHGISPALTVFAISSMMNQAIYTVENLRELVEQLSPNIQGFLGEIEQLSYTMLMISPDKKSVSYASAGMYPSLMKIGKKVIRLKANNTPFMNFSPIPDVSTLDIGEWDSLIIYSDGLVEHENLEIAHISPEYLLNNPHSLNSTIQEISSHQFNDDVTIIHLMNP